MTTCRICRGPVREFFDFGSQPLSDAFVAPPATGPEYRYRLAVGACGECGMVQLLEEVPRERMFHAGYPYHSSGSAVMRAHFAAAARRLREAECRRPDPFVVEIGCNDGIMLRTLAADGVRHLGIDPSRGVADLAAAAGVRVRVDFFEQSTALAVRAEEGPADVIFAANTICHIPYLDSVLRGVDALLAPDGVFVFEDPYLGDVLDRSSFDQIYDEHFYLFSATSVRAVAERAGLALVDVERLPVHGGEVRYTLARAGRRQPRPAVAALIGDERRRELTGPAALDRFAANVKHNCAELTTLLHKLRDDGAHVVGYGATAKSATVTNYCGIGPGLLDAVFDSTPAKQGRLTPGVHLPVRPLAEFRDPFPDYAVLFAWNHADEIIANEREFRERGGRWIMYVPEVRVI
ncbi:class I SAM-dependent methyltransferase [Pilimelia anulata]|nr:class I SAM-dependent methyltransferase [Pilimelia anulata]